jgi:Rrf2 family protein
MLYSNRCEHALRALTYLVRQRPGALTRTSEIARAEGIPLPLLGKALQQLVRAGILRSGRGPKGGYALAYRPADISLLEIRKAIDGTSDLTRCAVGLATCTDETPCPLHETFKPLRESIAAYLETTTLEDLAKGLWRKQAVLAQSSIREPTRRPSAQRNRR